MIAAASGEAPRSRGRAPRLWAGFLLLIAAAIAFAWYGAGSLRPVTSDSGLQFREIKAGTGEPIARSDAALVDYVLTADDGTVADSSESHGGPQPLTPEAVFPGFAEAMGRMREGGQYRFSMPQNLAWGDEPAPPGFPADSRLTFDVTVRKVVRGGGAMMRQMQEMQAQQQGAQPQGQPGQR